MKCSQCKDEVGKANIIIAELYWCPTCVYWSEHPEAMDYKANRKRSVKLQKEALFDGEQYERIDR